MGLLPCINHCRVYLQVLVLSDLVLADGSHVIPPFLRGNHLIARSSTLAWLNNQALVE